VYIASLGSGGQKGYGRCGSPMSRILPSITADVKLNLASHGRDEARTACNTF
jgi:hypothetical protein